MIYPQSWFNTNRFGMLTSFLWLTLDASKFTFFSFYSCLLFWKSFLFIPFFKFPFLHLFCRVFSVSIIPSTRSFLLNCHPFFILIAEFSFISVYFVYIHLYNFVRVCLFTCLFNFNWLLFPEIVDLVFHSIEMTLSSTWMVLITSFFARSPPFKIQVGKIFVWKLFPTFGMTCWSMIYSSY